MPAWITSLLREEVMVPMPSAASSTITSRAAWARRCEHRPFAAGLGQPPRDRKPDHPRSDDDAINLVHVSFGPENLAWKSALATLGNRAFAPRSSETP